MFKIFGKAVQDIEILNKGTGIGPAGVTILFTHGAAKCIAHTESVKNISLPHIDAISIHE